jgi:2,4-dienoyl-CoA reductase-like NADH-dependent reductase (Old Yellow Enzyme family)
MPKKYFDYDSLGDLRRDISHLNLNIPLDDDITPVFRPVRIGPLAAGNSLAIHPMEGCDGRLDGKPDELTYRRWERFGKGGAKLIWGEATAICEEGRANARQLWICEENAYALEDLLNRTRKAHRDVFGPNEEIIVGLQLTHSGRYSYRRPIIVVHDPVLDSLTPVDKKKHLPVTPDYPLVSDNDLERLEDDFVRAARLVWQIGFDFVDVKQCHRYLLSELLSAKTRPGRYGGSFENRTRLVLNVVGKMRDAVPDLVIASRFNAYDGIPYTKEPVTNVGTPLPYEVPYRYGFGTDENDPLWEDLTEPKLLVGLLHDKGVVMVNVSSGSPYTNPHIGRPFERPPVDGYETPEHPLLGVARHFRITAEIQRAYPDMVVVGTGYSWLQQYLLNAAAANMRTGRVTIAGIGRGALAYPDFVHDAMKGGGLDRRKVCLTVSYCTALMRAKHNELGQFPTGCVPRDRLYADIYKKSLKTK